MGRYIIKLYVEGYRLAPSPYHTHIANRINKRYMNMSKKNLNSALAQDIKNEVATVVETPMTNGEKEVGSRKKYDAVKVKAEAAPIINGITGVSAQIRKLASAGWERGKIAVALDKRYQHVRNVLTAPVKSA